MNSRTSPATAASWAQLCELAAGLLQDVPAGPLTLDLVVVPSAAHQRSLSQYLSVRSGGPQVTAGLEFVSIARLAGRVASAFIDSGLLPSDQWGGDGLGLGVLEVLHRPTQPAELEPLVSHLGVTACRPGRGYATASRLAQLFRRYARQCPDMVAAWRNGDDVGPTGTPLAGRDRWQPVLWRELRSALGPDPAERQEQLLALLADSAVPGLPGRVVVLHVDDPTPAQARLLDALAGRHDVHQFRLAGVPVDRERPGSSFLRHHASRSFDPGESLSGRSTTSEGTSAASSTTLLAQVQSEILADQSPSPRPAADDSLQIHASHGPDRQVQVLRDLLCGLFSDDPTLQPRDVVVLCPGLAEYAPLISASFLLDGDASLHPGHRLRVQLAAPSLPAFNPVFAVLGRLFELHAGRATSVDLMELCQLPPVAQRFGFTIDDLDRLHGLVDAAEIRWGVDADQRRRNGLTITQSTWLAGVQRLVLSLALDAQPPVSFGTVAPVAGVEGSDARLIGQFAELVSRVRKVWQGFSETAPAGVWVVRLREAIELLVRVSHDDEWQLSHALGEIAELEDVAGDRQAPLGAGDVAGWLSDRRLAASRRANYGNGSLLFTTLDDLAGIQARVVCVLGLDDQHFPGAPRIDGDDLLTRPDSGFATHWTDRLRERRRQRLLDALLAARDKFIVVTQGADESTGQHFPAPICVAELIEACAVSGENGQWRGEDGPNTLVRWHPLHPHGWADFLPAHGGPPAGFDRQALQGALALAAPKAAPPPAWQRRHPVEVPDEVDIDDLVAFFTNPARTLLRQATGTTLTEFNRELQVNLPITVDFLSKWQLGTEIFDSLVAGHDPDEVRRAAWLGGRVLAGVRGGRVIAEQFEHATTQAAAVRQARGGELRLVDCDVDIAGRRLHGRVGVYGGRVVVQRFGYVKPEQALICWLRLALLSAADRATDESVGLLIGKDCRQLSAPEPDLARQILTRLVELRDEGLQQVLPLPLQTAAAYADLLCWETREPLERARRAFEEKGEDANWRYFFPTFDDLCATGRFPDLASEVLGPIVAGLQRWQPAEPSAEEACHDGA